MLFKIAFIFTDIFIVHGTGTDTLFRHEGCCKTRLPVEELMQTWMIVWLVVMVIAKGILIVFVLKKVKKRITRIASMTYIIIFAPLLSNAFAIISRDPVGIVAMAFLAIGLDLGVVQWFRALWERSKDTEDIKYDPTLTN